MSHKRVARVYAEALFSAAQKQGQEEELGQKLASLKERFEEDAELQRILQQQFVSPQEREEALKALLPRLLNREKDELLMVVVSEYKRLLDKAKNMELMEVTVAAPLSPALESELEIKLSDFIGKKIRLQTRVDPKILGGLVLRWGDQVLDASVKKKLEQIGTHLKTV